MSNPCLPLCASLQCEPISNSCLWRDLPDQAVQQAGLSQARPLHHHHRHDPGDQQRLQEAVWELRHSGAHSLVTTLKTNKHCGVQVTNFLVDYVVDTARKKLDDPHSQDLATGFVSSTFSFFGSLFFAHLSWTLQDFQSGFVLHSGKHISVNWQSSWHHQAELDSFQSEVKVGLFPLCFSLYYSTCEKCHFCHDNIHWTENTHWLCFVVLNSKCLSCLQTVLYQQAVCLPV